MQVHMPAPGTGSSSSSSGNSGSAGAALRQQIHDQARNVRHSGSMKRLSSIPADESTEIVPASTAIVPSRRQRPRTGN